MRPVHFTICIKKDEVPIGELRPGDEIVSQLEIAFKAIEDVKKFHPNAEISVKVEM